MGKCHLLSTYKYRKKKVEKNMEHKEHKKHRNYQGKKAGAVGIVTNILLALGKLMVGIVSSSVSITADALNNLMDAASSIVTLVGFKLAEKPADEEHPFGHARSEYLAGLVVAMMIFVVGYELVISSIKKIINPSAVGFSGVVAVVLVASIAVKFGLSSYYKKVGEQISSKTLIAASVDSRNDVIMTTAVLIASVVEYFTKFQMDGYIGLAVAVFIVYSGINLAKETMSPLLGEGINEELKETLEDYILSCPKVVGCHDLIVHDYGPNHRFASIHVEMDKNEDPLVCHELIDDMEQECMKSHGVHLVIHYDPIVTDDPEAERLRQLVITILQVKDERLSIHDFRMVQGQGHENLIFDVLLPRDLKGQEKNIQNSIETALNAIEPKTYYTKITFDTAFIHN